MSLKTLGNFNNQSITGFKATNIPSNLSKNDLAKKPDFQSIQDTQCVPTTTKLGVLFTTLVGIGVAMSYAKGHGLPINPSRLFKKSPAEWGLFDVKFDSEKKEVEKLVAKLAFGSVGGGLVGGALFDKKENMSAKCREAVIQLVGNIFTPLLCVAGGMRLFKNYEPKVLDSMKFLKGNFKGLPKLIVSGASLVAGIVLGNKVGNITNEKMFNIKDNRKIKLSDMSPHIDDLCLALSLVGSDTPILTRIIPAALLIAGYSTGVAQEKPDRCQKNINENKPV